MSGPHQGEPLVTTGESLDSARVALVLVHGRGRDPNDMFRMVADLPRQGVGYVAPQAAGHSWYPEPFQAPIAENEPGRSSAIEAVEDAIQLANREEIATEQVVIVGFSQGACIASEYVAHRPRRYGGLASLSGGIMGETPDPDEYSGDLDGTPVLLGSTEEDPYMPEERVHESAEIFTALGGDVTTRVYPGNEHTINDDEVEMIRRMIERAMPSGR